MPFKRANFWTCVLAAAVFAGIVAVFAAARGDRELLRDLASAVAWTGSGALFAAVLLSLFGALE